MLSHAASVADAAAQMDGAGPVRVFVSIVLPMSRNALVTAALFSFLFAWSDFLFALTLTTTDDVRPVTLGLYTYVGAFVADWSCGDGHGGARPRFPPWCCWWSRSGTSPRGRRPALSSESTKETW